MNMDERFERILSEHGPAYHEPGVIPHQEMWERIREARQPRRVAPFRTPPRWAQGVAAAAALLILGIAIGRYTADAPSSGGATDPIASAEGPTRSSDAARPYRMAANEYFGRVEILLTQFDRATGSDDEVSGWARSLLADTRLLLNSPAGLEPEYRALLADLELVLTQIVHAAGRHDQDERRWVNEGMEQSGVLQRLRMLKPAKGT